jgi:type I restriction enzyme S subunit
MVVADEWRQTSLRDVVTKLVDGSHNPPSKQESGFPMLSARNVENGRIVFDEFRYIERSAFEQENNRTRITPGDVLLTIVGTIGRTAVVPHGFEPFALQRSVAVLTPKSDLLPKFLCYQLQAPRVQRYFEENARGTAQKGVYLKTLGATPVVVPSVSTQDAIVAEIEKQFSHLDEAVANLQRVKANLKRYKAAVLKAAVEGRLVETEAEVARREGRSYETGEQLLERILEARRSHWKGCGKYKEPSPPAAIDVGKLPEGWGIASLDMLSNDSGYGTSQKCSYDNSGPAVLRIPNVQGGVLDLRDVKFAPTEYKLAESEAVSSGDMLIIRTNGSKSLIGRAAIVMADPIDQMSFASYLIRFRLTSRGSIPAWVSLVWQTSEMREWIESQAATSAGQHNVSMTVLAKAAIALPSVPEQQRIVAEVDRRLSIVREVEVEVDANLKRAQALRSAVLGKAFGAGLVPNS